MLIGRKILRSFVLHWPQEVKQPPTHTHKDFVVIKTATTACERSQEYYFFLLCVCVMSSSAHNTSLGRHCQYL
jgi:hypothetical protein